MGLIGRFQRKGMPSSDHSDCIDLSSNDISRLRFLAAVVRLAAALDRTRQERVQDIELKIVDKTLTITLIHTVANPPDVELHKARLEKQALEKSWDLDIRFELRALNSIETG